jgi:hypothetical protein
MSMQPSESVADVSDPPPVLVEEPVPSKLLVSEESTSVDVSVELEVPTSFTRTWSEQPAQRAMRNDIFEIVFMWFSP